MSAGRVSPRLLAIWGLLAVLVAAIVWVELTDRARTQEEDRAASVSVDPRALLPVPLGQVGAIEIAHAGAVHRFERDAQGLWFYHGAHVSSDPKHTHQTDPERARKIDVALTGFGRTRTERRLPLDKGAEEYGLATPQMVILAYRPQELQPLAQFAVGDIAPDTVSRYVMVVGGTAVVTIPNYQIENLLSLIKAMGDGSAPTKPSGKPAS